MGSPPVGYTLVTIAARKGEERRRRSLPDLSRLAIALSVFSKATATSSSRVAWDHARAMVVDEKTKISL